MGDTGRLRGHQAQPWCQGSFPGGSRLVKDEKNLMCQRGVPVPRAQWVQRPLVHPQLCSILLGVAGQPGFLSGPPEANV